MPEKKLETEYGKYIRFKRLFLIIMIIVMLVIALVAIASGSSGLTLGEVINTILGNGDAKTKVVVFNLRLPRIVTAVVAGIGLAVVGCVMQSILRNPLASSSTLGVSQGAAFGAAFAIIALDAGMQSQTLDGVAISNPYTTSICAFVGSMLSTLVACTLSALKMLPCLWTCNLSAVTMRYPLLLVHSCGRQDEQLCCGWALCRPGGCLRVRRRAVSRPWGACSRRGCTLSA